MEAQRCSNLCAERASMPLCEAPEFLAKLGWYLGTQERLVVGALHHFYEVFG